MIKSIDFGVKQDFKSKHCNSPAGWLRACYSTFVYGKKIIISTSKGYDKDYEINFAKGLA